MATNYQSYCDVCKKLTSTKDMEYDENYHKNNWNLRLDNHSFDSFGKQKLSDPDWVKEREVGYIDLCFECSLDLAHSIKDHIRLKKQIQGMANENPS